MKVSCKVNKGNKFWDLCYCPFNRGCSLNTGFTVLEFRVLFFLFSATKTCSSPLLGDFD